MYVPSVRKWKKKKLFLFLRVISAVCTEILFYSTNSKVLMYAVRDYQNNFFVQFECIYYVFRITKPKTYICSIFYEYQQSKRECGASFTIPIFALHTVLYQIKHVLRFWMVFCLIQLMLQLKYHCSAKLHFLPNCPDMGIYYNRM